MSSPTSLGEVIQQASEGPQLAARLKKALGLGSQPELRMSLYQRLEDFLYESPQGPRVLEVIDSVVQDSRGKNDPGRYFASVVLRRLEDRGLLEKARPVEW